MAISRVRIYEVGPRDGLQNEARIVSARDKIEFIRLLSLSGLTNIEATAFVRSVSQMADAQEVYTSVRDF
ncbi:MAG TPA: hydroxymethylglutaryl-CoA lyase, partial [Leptospiraceae bacterium]|nr:hydroxymethylglutaryl-CoA lyase [Leptospiraceae bacterium]